MNRKCLVAATVLFIAFACVLVGGCATKSCAPQPAVKAPPLWQDKVADLVRRITSELGASGVYIDQVSAMAAVLCCDDSHGHPRGGGGWWRRGYGRMLGKARRASGNAALTTECNAEPYLGWLDAYLMWHCMFPGQVPAFSALYGSRVRMFGRAGVGGLANLRALTAQSWVFGEQIGWFSPSTVTGSGEAFAAFLPAPATYLAGSTPALRSRSLSSASDFGSRMNSSV